mgnify:CR=1 FL=1
MVIKVTRQIAFRAGILVVFLINSKWGLPWFVHLGIRRWTGASDRSIFLVLRLCVVAALIVIIKQAYVDNKKVRIRC